MWLGLDYIHVSNDNSCLGSTRDGQIKYFPAELTLPGVKPIPHFGFPTLLSLLCSNNHMSTLVCDHECPIFIEIVQPYRIERTSQ